MSEHQPDIKKPQTSTEQNIPAETHENQALNPAHGTAHATPPPPNALQRAVSDPSRANLTPDVVRQMQRRYGNRFTASLVARRRSDSGSGSHIQRVFDLVMGNPVGPQHTDQEALSVEAMMAVLREHREELKQYESEGKEADVDTYLDHERFQEIVTGLFKSSVNFGRIDPDNVQQLSLIYFKIKQQLDPNQTTGQGESEEEERKAQAKKQESAEQWLNYVEAVQQFIQTETQVAGAEILKLAILGRGASVGYYLANNAANIDPATTKIIGMDNPWARQRGGGVINHPMNMIAPEGDTEYLDDKEGLANRARFAEVIEAVIQRMGEDSIVDAAITGVKKKGAGATSHYEITTSEGIFYAQNVVVGMGIGGHKNPDDDPKGTKERGKLTGTTLKRIMNMDDFQVAVTNGTITADLINSMVIVGPNAAIDVMTTAIRKGFKNVSWIVGIAKDPFFLGGTDNIYAQKKYKETVKKENEGKDDKKAIFKQGDFTVYQHDYLSFTASDENVAINYGVREDKQKQTPEEVKGAVTADIMVYGTGPDVAALQKLLGIDRKGENVEAIYDTSQTFNAGETYGDEVERALLRYITGLNGNREEKAQGVIEIISNVLGGFTKNTHKNAMPETLPQVLGLKAKNTSDEDQSSLQIIGGSASRIAGEARMKYTYVSQAFQGMIDDYMTPFKSMTDFQTLGDKQKDKDFDKHAINFLIVMEEFLGIGLALAKAIEGADDISKVDDPASKINRLRNLYLDALKHLRDMLQVDIFAVSGNRDFRRMDGLLHTGDTAFTQLKELLASFQKSKYSTQMSTQMGGVNNSLPQNVVLNDQLTSTRSGIEGLVNNMPSNVEDEVNFVTANQNVIGAYIASGYGNIPPVLANYLTERIVTERRTRNDVLPKPQDDPNMENPDSKFTVQNQRKFVEEWTIKIDALNQALDPSTLKK